ncbi:hypothetical protein [Pedobacter punctiformis]|uniref:Beta-lactamase-inhibitor-like PepSY-like domain-containing protein n=1 Tax=Pedobacter punctiformis TaxID=3004097 RepID=A0ABT4L830_9SPHI|nr:hypothetical protein [Pedobacter sp. HCMS5-2]MCZ4244084.1 hypothetical protein [Pedobacter sp. HCMS5-2]
MKKIFGVFILIGSLITTSQAQKLNALKVPAAVKSAFSKSHPATTNVHWEMEKQDYEAGFTLNGKKTSALYSAKGILLETEVEINKSELPILVITKLKGIRIAETAKITKANGTVLYEAEVKGKDLLFDASGNPVKP